jgi:hypothetical protein
MGKMTLSTKRLQINQANVTIVIATSIAAFVTIFSLVAARALISQYSYQSKVIAKKEVAKMQLQANIVAVNSLLNSYQQFVSQPDNIIGGTATGQGDRDGDNARIILDALPSKYDFPAVATSIEKLVTERNAKIVKITGTDDEVNQQATESSATPEPVEIPFEVGAESNYQTAQDLIGVFERSIRPVKLTGLTLAGKDSTLTLTLKAKTYYQPEKALSIKSEVVK